MSRTDKTRPYWVQIRDPQFPYVIKELHRHYRTECDLDFPVPITRRDTPRGCEWWPRYRDNDKIYGRARAVLRQLCNKWKKEVNLEDIDSNEDLPTQRWLWRGWYWD